MNFLRLPGNVVGITLQLEGGAAADYVWIPKKNRLERDDRLLPAQRAAGFAVDATRRLFEPTSGYVVTLELP